MEANAASHVGRIGPNAIIQLVDALEQALGSHSAGELVRAVGLGRYLDVPPVKMVDEREVIALHTAVREQLPAPTARRVARAAGLATADYLLANRIPPPVQWLLKALPATLASRVLLAAITRHAWTFAGSGHFVARAGRPVVITIGDCAICRGARAPGPTCDYYAATFERLYARLVQARARVTETACVAASASACRFEIRWS